MCVYIYRLSLIRPNKAHFIDRFKPRPTSFFFVHFKLQGFLSLIELDFTGDTFSLVAFVPSIKWHTNISGRLGFKMSRTFLYTVHEELNSSTLFFASA